MTVSLEAGCSDSSESILSLIASLAATPSCAQEYPWIELLLNALHRRAVRRTEDGIRDKAGANSIARHKIDPMVDRKEHGFGEYTPS